MIIHFFRYNNITLSHRIPNNLVNLVHNTDNSFYTYTLKRQYKSKIPNKELLPSDHTTLLYSTFIYISPYNSSIISRYQVFLNSKHYNRIISANVPTFTNMYCVVFNICTMRIAPVPSPIAIWA